MEVDEPRADQVVAKVPPGDSLQRRRLIPGKNAEDSLPLDEHDSAFQHSSRENDVSYQGDFFHMTTFYSRWSRRIYFIPEILKNKSQTRTSII
jgi:hypothetical protein